jgi:uncharacterized protein YndB with AHSA1/START domain
MAEPTTGNEVRITRVFDAPRELVFRTWTEADHVARWWGPDGFETPRASVAIEPRTGGRYELDMVDPGGATFPVRQEILEIVEPELLVLRHEAMPEMGMPEPTITRVELSDEDGRTRMVLTSGPYPEHMGANAATGWNMSLDKMERILAG